MNQNVNLDLIPKFAVFGNLYFSQYDVGRTATINLLNGTEAYTIPSGATVKIQATKPSGLGFNESCTFSGNVVTVVSTETMTDEAGRIPCELQITSGDTILGTANFLFNVERSPHPEGTTDGTAESVVNEITLALENALQELSDAVDPVVAEAVDEAETQMEAIAQEVIATIPSDYTELNNEVDELQSCFDIEEYEPVNLLDYDAVTFGYYCTDTGAIGANSTYWYTDYIPVEVGKTYSRQCGNLTVSQGRRLVATRWISCYDADKNVLSDKGSSASPETFTVPEGVAYIRFSDAYYMSPQAEAHPTVVQGTAVLDYSEYFEPYKTYTLKAECNNDAHIQELINNSVSLADGKLIFEASANTLESGTDLTIAERIDNKKNCSYLLFAQFSSFGSISFGHGFSEYGGSYITVDDTNIYQYYHNGTQPILQNTYPHGLNISDFLFINIDVADILSVRAKVTLMTAEGQFEQANVPFAGCNGNIIAKTTSTISNVKCQYICNDAKNDVYVFGDSYISLGDPSRWPNQAMSNGYSKYLLSGYSGASSQFEIISFRNILAVKKPKFVVWALGMNDGDTSSDYNANWKTYVDEVISTCEANGVVPILATIPNVPNIIHTFKNEWIRNSGYRYVDFAKAVGAESQGSTWYSGMLSSDNTHPSELGAKALANRFILDVPEVVYEN